MDRIAQSAPSANDEESLTQTTVRQFNPNAETLAAFTEIERGEGKSCNTVAELLAELNAED